MEWMAWKSSSSPTTTTTSSSHGLTILSLWLNYNEDVEEVDDDDQRYIEKQVFLISVDSVCTDEAEMIRLFPPPPTYKTRHFLWDKNRFPTSSSISCCLCALFCWPGRDETQSNQHPTTRRRRRREGGRMKRGLTNLKVQFDNELSSASPYSAAPVLYCTVRSRYILSYTTTTSRGSRGGKGWEKKKIS